jgi:hypothetical protein
MRWLYLSLALLGAVLPFSQFVPWVAAHGLDVPLMIRELFSTRIGAFFGIDVLVSAPVLLVFIAREGVTRKMRRLWFPIGATCLIGVSCGLPLFLYMRERTLSATPNNPWRGP